MDQPLQPPDTRSFPWIPIAISVVVTAALVTTIAVPVIWNARGASSSRLSEVAELREERAVLQGHLQSLLSVWDDPIVEETGRGVVATFLELTLPPNPVNYTTASILLTEPLASALRDDPSVIPRWYGIQDGPSAVTVFAARQGPATMTVRAGAFYGTPTGLLNEERADRLWDFRLAFTSTGWRIAAIDVVAQTISE